MSPDSDNEWEAAAYATLKEAAELDILTVVVAAYQFVAETAGARPLSSPGIARFLALASKGHEKPYGFVSIDQPRSKLLPIIVTPEYGAVYDKSLLGILLGLSAAQMKSIADRDLAREAKKS